MNNIIKEQLGRCKIALIPNFDNKTTCLHIKKVNIISPNNMLPNHSYLIKIKESVKNNNTLASNWNKGMFLKYNYYKVEKIDSIGNMLKLNGIAVENNQDIYSEPFYGYLPIDGFEIIEEV